MDGTRGPPPGQVHHRVRHLVVRGAAVGDHDTGEPAIPRPHQPGGPPVCHRRGEARQAGKVPLKNVRSCPLSSGGMSSLFFTLLLPFLPSSLPSLPLPLSPPPNSSHMMQGCWKRYSSDRPHFEQILTILATFMDRLKRPDSVYYSESESEDEVESNNVAQRQGSGKLPSRTPSIREGEGKAKVMACIVQDSKCWYLDP